ncbi:MAG: DUF4394 domain-containing protein [Synechococcales cyanobacterium RM1_1_8]|nr:DUF4394 domain-containing protein [Synechococcales cyanobacterium RM1_1_8]
MNTISDAIVSILAGDAIDSDGLRSFLNANPELSIIILNLISESIDTGKPIPTLADVAAFLGDRGLMEEGLFFSGLFDVDAGFSLNDAPALIDNAKFLGLTDNNELLLFTANAPERASPVRVDGLDGNLLGIDVRPADGKIYGLTTANKLYRLAPPPAGEAGSYRATLISTLDIPFAGGTISGFDFNPAADRLRLIGDNDQNFRINVDTGAVIVDGALAFADGDLNSGTNPNITASAYTNAFSGTTTTQLYNIDTLLNQLVLQTPPNNGTLVTIGDLGVDFDTLGGFDILSDGTGGNAAFAVSDGLLYSIDLDSGAATSLGSLGNGAQLNLQGLVAIAATPDDSDNLPDAQTLFGTAASDRLVGGAGDDILYGNGGEDQLVGGSGHDLIYGGAEADIILGGSGDDIIYGNGGADVIDSGTGRDEIWLGGASNATIRLSSGEGFVAIKNFQQGQTQLQFAGAVTYEESLEGAMIFSGSDLLAVVAWNPVSRVQGSIAIA